MSESKHSPGPWEAEKTPCWTERLHKNSKDHFRVIGPNGDAWTPIAVCSSNAMAIDNDANARLIAAAPDMYAALDAQRAADRAMESPNWQELEDIATALRVGALAKAEARS